jgi:hypothetical protein
MLVFLENTVANYILKLLTNKMFFFCYILIPTSFELMVVDCYCFIVG